MGKLHHRAPAVPTAFLPPLKRLEGYSADALSIVLESLRVLYEPATRQSSSPSSSSVDSGYASAYDVQDHTVDLPAVARSLVADEELEEAWEIARNDPLERDYAMRWMTGFLAAGLEWVAAAESEDGSEEYTSREAVYDRLSSLLSACSMASESGALDREFLFADGAIKVVLKDEDLSPTDHTSVGLQTWGAAAVMAERIIQSPESYGLSPASPSPDRPIRILELGAGTGLLGLAVGAFLVREGISAQIVATDYHAAVLANLEENIRANPLSTCCSSNGVAVSIEAAPLDWQLIHEFPSSDSVVLPDALKGNFDLIIASDVVYAPSHALWLSSVVRQFLRRPSTSSSYTPSCHIIAANRPTHYTTHSSIREAFAMPSGDADGEGMKGVCIVDAVDIGRMKNIGRADEDGYREYRIEWR